MAKEKKPKVKESVFSVKCTQEPDDPQKWWHWKAGGIEWRWSNVIPGINCHTHTPGEEVNSQPAWNPGCFFRNLEQAVCFSQGFESGLNYARQTGEGPHGHTNAQEN